MSTTYIGPYGEDPSIAFVSEGVVNHAGHADSLRDEDDEDAA